MSSAPRPLMILVAGPYRSGTGDDPWSSEQRETYDRGDGAHLAQIPADSR